ncbi:hypothetical protein ACFLZX_01440 [Nanoarchaeota archaeon]
MPDPRITSFIRQNLQLGYDINTIKGHLLQQGFVIKDINDAVDSIYGIKEVHHVIHLPPVLLIILGVAGVGLLGLVLLLTLGGDDKDGKLLDVEPVGVKTTAEAGEDLVFTVKISNLGSEKRYDITLRYELLDNNNNRVTFKEETIAVETTADQSVMLRVPPRTSAGSYLIKITAKYGEVTTPASLPATVITSQSVGSCFDGSQNQDEDGVDCGGSCTNSNCCNNNFRDVNLGEEGVDCGGPCNACETECDRCDDGKACTDDFCGPQTNFICINEIITPCCGNGLCESGENDVCLGDCPKGGLFDGLSEGEILRRIKDIATSDPGTAKSYCGTYLTGIFKDDCFIYLATDQSDDSICRSVENARHKDRCYSEVSISTQSYQPCEKISDDTKRDSCYVNYAMASNDYVVCDFVLDSNMKRMCDTLRDAYQATQSN